MLACKHFARGSCSLGDACAFTHGDEPGASPQAGVGFMQSTAPWYGVDGSFRASDTVEAPFGEAVDGPSVASAAVNKLKTRLCRTWENTGTCFQGDTCRFAHGEWELQPTSQAGPGLAVKTKLCTFFANGACTKGATCSFAHGEEELGTSGTSMFAFPRAGVSVGRPFGESPFAAFTGAEKNGAQLEDTPLHKIPTRAMRPR